jgi:hypothetical protein
MRHKGYNVYALGARGSGRHSLVEHLLRHKAATEPTPPDWCYVNNFGDPQRPHRLQLPSGRANGLSVAMKRLVEELRASLPAAFERDEYRARREVIEQQFKQRSEQTFGALQRRAEAKNITLLRTPTGLALAPKRDGKVLTSEMFEELPAVERERVEHELEGIQSELDAIMQQVPQWEREHREAVRVHNRETTACDRSPDGRCAPYLICRKSLNTSTRRTGRQGKCRRLPRPSSPQAARKCGRAGSSERRRAVSPLSGQHHCRQWLAARRPGHLRG